jgi:hypothetical protein
MPSFFVAFIYLHLKSIAQIIKFYSFHSFIAFIKNTLDRLMQPRVF